MRFFINEYHKQHETVVTNVFKVAATEHK